MSTALRFLGLAAVLAALQLPAAAEAFDDIVALAEDRIEDLPGDTVAIYPFPFVDGIPSVEGGLLAERVETALSERGRVRVVDRALLDEVMKEQRLGASGLVNPETSVRVGKLLGVHGFLTGTITDMGENIEIHVRLVNVENGETVASRRLTTRRSIKTFISPLWSRIDRIKKESESFGVRLWVDDGGKPLSIPGARIGDTVKINFQADEDCYVTIFDFTTGGSIHVLFPNAFMPDNFVRAGRVYTFPSDQAGFQIRVQGPPGVERLKLFATTKDVPLFEQDFATESFRSVTEEKPGPVRDLEVVLKNIEANRWAETQLELRIERNLRGAEPPPAEAP